jgi:hypothetical protein
VSADTKLAHAFYLCLRTSSPYLTPRVLFNDGSAQTSGWRLKASVPRFKKDRRGEEREVTVRESLIYGPELMKAFDLFAEVEEVRRFFRPENVATLRRWGKHKDCQVFDAPTSAWSPCRSMLPALQHQSAPCCHRMSAGVYGFLLFTFLQCGRNAKYDSRARSNCRIWPAVEESGSSEDMRFRYRSSG